MVLLLEQLNQVLYLSGGPNFFWGEFVSQTIGLLKSTES